MMRRFARYLPSSSIVWSVTSALPRSSETEAGAALASAPQRTTIRASLAEGSANVRVPMSTVKIPPVLRASTGGEREVAAEGANVGDVLRSLARQHPATESQLFAQDGSLNRYVNVYLNDEDVRVLDGLETPVGERDTLVILPAMAGG